MSTSTANDKREVAVFDDRPFFERALVYGVRNRIIDQATIDRIQHDAPKGMVQIAEHFGTQYLRPNIEEARVRIVRLVSLYLEEFSGGDLAQAARSLRDNSFLSHSRGGSDLLKRLWAMPEDSSIGLLVNRSQKSFLADWSLRTPGEYRQALAQRRANQLTISAALWFADRLGLPRAAMVTVAAESVIRSGLLVQLDGRSAVGLPNAAEFAEMLSRLRKKGVAGKGRKRLQAILRDLPPALEPVVARELGRLESEDLRKIGDPARPLGELMRELEPLYFLRDFGPEDAGHFDAVAATDWHRITDGKTDDSSLLTVFVCLAVGNPARPTLTRSAARALIGKARSGGFRRSPAVDFIRTLAPYAMQEDLEVLWNEFFPEAETYLLDASDTSLADALSFLREHCNVV